MATKVCTKCGEEKDEGEFHKRGEGRKSRCKKCISEYQKEYVGNNRDKYRENNLRWYWNNRGGQLYRGQEWHRKRRATLKLESFYAYGGPVCRGCGIDDPDVLTIDHIDPTTVVRMEKALSNKKREGSTKLYTRLKEEGFPSGYQVLCFNCNIKKHLEYERSKRNAN